MKDTNLTPSDRFFNSREGRSFNPRQTDFDDRLYSFGCHVICDTNSGADYGVFMGYPYKTNLDFIYFYSILSNELSIVSRKFTNKDPTRYPLKDRYFAGTRDDIVFVKGLLDDNIVKYEQLDDDLAERFSGYSVLPPNIPPK